MKSFKILFIPFVLLFASYGWATPKNQLPDELMYHGKPIDAVCLFEIVDTVGTVDLSKCGLNLSNEHRILGTNKQLISQGFVGYDYRLKKNDSTYLQGYSYYKAVGKVDDAIIVQTINNSGGTGTFSFLNLVERQGNILKISVLNGGDRCNGAVVDMKRIGEGANAQLIYKVSLTANDFLALANDNPKDVKAYNGLATCAACCAATAVYQRNVGADFNHEKLLYVDASAYLKSDKNAPSSQPYQACFDKMFREYGRKNHGKLDAQQLSLFTQQFNAQCVQSKS